MPAVSMTDNKIENAFNELFAWCRARNFAGHDPFDALNSRIFKVTPFTNSRTARLIWTQLCKRSPVNLRPLARVPAGRNAKGIALFALAALANYRRQKNVEAESEARDLLDELIDLQLAGYSGAAWGYNFDWQSRHFFAPRGTAMIVPTAFAVRALIDGAETLGERQYLELAHSSCEVVTKDLNRSCETSDEVCFSYSPIDQTCVFNASLLAAEMLALAGAVLQQAEFSELAVRAARFVVNRQRPDGAWPYGAGSNQSWVDNFHTAYILQSLDRIIEHCAEARVFAPALALGYRFWRERFFLADGWPKYYDDALYPADTHSGATAILTLLQLQRLDPNARSLAQAIAAWLIENMRDGEGFFYSQRHRFYRNRVPFMRWSQAWMAYALARLLEENS